MTFDFSQFYYEDLLGTNPQTLELKNEHSSLSYSTKLEGAGASTITAIVRNEFGYEEEYKTTIFFRQNMKTLTKQFNAIDRDVNGDDIFDLLTFISTTIYAFESDYIDSRDQEAYEECQ